MKRFLGGRLPVQDAVEFLHDEVLPSACAGGYSSSRTCEIGLSDHAGIPYRSIFKLVDDCATAPPT